MAKWHGSFVKYAYATVEATSQADAHVKLRALKQEELQLSLFFDKFELDRVELAEEEDEE